MLTYWGKLFHREKESFQNRGSWIIVLGNWLPVLWAFRICVIWSCSLTPWLLSKIYTLPLQSTLKKTFGFGGHRNIWDGALYGLVFLLTEQAFHLSLKSTSYLNDNYKDAQDNLINSSRSLHPTPTPRRNCIFHDTIGLYKSPTHRAPLHLRLMPFKYITYLCLYILFFNSLYTCFW